MALGHQASNMNVLFYYDYQSGTLPFSVALRELPYTVTPFDRATENGSSGH